MDLFLIGLLMSTVIKTSHSLPLSNRNSYNYNKYDNFRDRHSSDLISGNEFLSIVVENSQPRDVDLSRKLENKKYIVDPFEEDESNEGVLPIEVMFTSATTHSRMQTKYRFQQTKNRNYQQNRNDEKEKEEKEKEQQRKVEEEDSKEPLVQPDFEFERIDKRKSNNQQKVEQQQEPLEDSADSESTNTHVITTFGAPPNTDPQDPQQQQVGNNFRNQRQQQHDLLFASHSATVTLSGPSGPFKAIICHDCDRKNQDGQTVPHSVSFSAIKNWNVGSAAKKQQQQQQQQQNEGNNEESSGGSAVDSSQSDEVNDTSEIEKDVKEPVPDTGFDEDVWAKKVDPQINQFRDPASVFTHTPRLQAADREATMQKFPPDVPKQFVPEQPQIYNPEPLKPFQPEPTKAYTPEVQITYNSEPPQVNYNPEPQTKQTFNPEPPQNQYNQQVNQPTIYNTENMFKQEANKAMAINNNAEMVPAQPQPHWRYLPPQVNGDAAGKVPQRKPIFTDLIKVPYDTINAPLDEYAMPAKPKLPLQINQQQTFDHNVTSNYQHFQQFIQKTLSPTMSSNHNSHHYHSTPQPEQNYEVDEAVSVLTNGKAHGIQTTTSTTPLPLPSTTTQIPVATAPGNSEGIDLSVPNSPNPTQNPQDSKFGYVVEGRDYRKYRVEEKTPDGFIVGEYGVVSNNDGSPLRGVRYTADSNINPRLIYDALLKFLSL